MALGCDSRLFLEENKTDSNCKASEGQADLSHLSLAPLPTPPLPHQAAISHNSSSKLFFSRPSLKRNSHNPLAIHQFTRPSLSSSIGNANMYHDSPGLQLGSPPNSHNFSRKSFDSRPSFTPSSIVCSSSGASPGGSLPPALGAVLRASLSSAPSRMMRMAGGGSATTKGGGQGGQGASGGALKAQAVEARTSEGVHFLMKPLADTVSEDNHC